MNNLSHSTQDTDNNELRTFSIKCLLAIFCLGLAALVVTMISWLPISDGWTVWVKRTFTVGKILCLFLLTPINLRYRRAAFFNTANFCCTILNLLIGSTLLTFLFSLISVVFSAAACWQIYQAHSELISGHSEKLAQNWKRLFWWKLALSAISAVIFIAAYILFYFPHHISFDVISAFSTLSSWIIVILNTILTVISLIFLFLTIQILKRQD